MNVEIFWKPALHTDDENLRWSYLRAIEWGSLPGFLFSNLGAVAVLWAPLWLLACGCLALSITWSAVRYRWLPTLRALDLLPYVGMLRIPVVIACAVYAWVRTGSFPHVLEVSLSPVAFMIL